MITDPYNYIQLGVGSTKSKRQIVKVLDLDNILDYTKANYRSWVLFDHGLSKHFKKAKNVKGYNDKSSADYLPIDIDNDGNLKESLRVCRFLVVDLVENLEVDPSVLQIYFSGSKGFHIHIPTELLGMAPVSTQNELCYRFKWIMNQLDHPVDMAIYKTNMLWRIANTPHEKTGLYKIPLHYQELCSLTINEIQKLAKSPKEINWIDGSEWGTNETLKILWENSGKVFANINKNQIKTNISVNGNLKFRYMSKGNRNESCFNNALAAKSNGLTIQQTLELLLNWNSGNYPPLSEYEIKKTVEQAFSYNNFSNPDTGIKTHLREDHFIQTLVPRDYIIYVDLLCRFNTVTKSWHGITIQPNQQVISYRSVANRLTKSKRKEDIIDRYRVERLIKKLVKIGRISKEIVLDENDNPRTLISLHDITTNATPV